MRRWIVFVIGLWLVPAVASAQKVYVDSDPSASFAAYRTYGWTAGTPSSNPLADNRIHASVDQQMAAKGFMAAANPDVFVATHVITHDQKELVATGFGPGWGFGGYGTASVETYVQGTLVVDLYDAQTKKLVWRAKATETVSDKPEKNTAKINKALAKMFEQYPPRQK
jgi:uncharacterized protein DUF4136